MKNLDAGHRLHLQNVDGDDVPGLTDALCRNLGPAARRCTKIKDTRAFLQEMEFGIEFDQLEGGTAAVAFAFRGVNIRIVQLPLEPTARRDGAALAASHSHAVSAAT